MVLAKETAFVDFANIVPLSVVPVFNDVADATPKIGVIKVGVLSTTNFVPVPVLDAIDVALPTDVITPVKFALVVTLPAVKPDAVPVIFVPTNVDGVPKFGVTKVGEVLKTKLVDVVPVVPVALLR